MLNGAWTWESDPGSGIPEAPEHVCEKVQCEHLFFSTIEFCRAYGNHWKDMKQQYHLMWDDANYTTPQELQTGFLIFDWIRRQAVWQIWAVDYCLCKCGHIHGNFQTMLPDIGSDAEMEVEVDGEEPNEQIHRPILHSHCFSDDDEDATDDQEYGQSIVMGCGYWMSVGPVGRTWATGCIQHSFPPLTGRFPSMIPCCLVPLLVQHPTVTQKLGRNQVYCIYLDRRYLMKLGPGMTLLKVRGSL